MVYIYVTVLLLLLDNADSDGHLSRTRLLPDNQQTSVDTDQLCPLPIVNAIETGLAVVAIDSAQVAVVSPASRDDQSE